MSNYGLFLPVMALAGMLWWVGSGVKLTLIACTDQIIDALGKPNTDG
jgi:hypothetical protein